MTQKYMAESRIEWRHPKDDPPPGGAKVLLYMHPNGVTIVGEFNKSGAKLWAPLPRVSREMKDRLDREAGR